MKTAAIICEYNPFHMGHRHQLDSLRGLISDDALCIVALMSGCYVQRGGMTVLSPGSRAEIALSAGANVVLELPFPWSMSGADYFAGGALTVLEEIGGIDYLCFGSECSDLTRLWEDARILRSAAFSQALDSAAAAYPNLSWAKVRETAYESLCGKPLFRYAPNDLLAISYLIHLKKIKPLPIPRMSGFSASASREAYQSGDLDRLIKLVPAETLEALERRRPKEDGSIDQAVLASLFLMSPAELSGYAECSPELAGLIRRSLPKTQSVEGLVNACCNAKYTAARVRRAIWHCFLRTPQSAPKEKPAYTRLLAADRRGREWIASRRKESAFPILTRASNAEGCDVVRRQYRFAVTRTELYHFLTGDAEKRIPIIK